MQHNHKVRELGLPLALAVLLLVTAFLRLPGVSAQTALPLEENFDYGASSGTLVAVSGGLWTAYSGTSGYVQYDPSTNLSLSGYPASGIGGSAEISRMGVEDVYRRFTPPASGDLYVASLMSLSSAGGGYFFHLKDATSNFPARVWARASGGNLQFGLSYGETVTWSNQLFAYNTTYLVVLKYSLLTGASALYVLSSHTPFEPAPLLTATGAVIAVESVAIRQSAFSPVTPDATIDGIRIATTWLDAVGAPIHVAKSAPAVVITEQTFTYTITTTNNTDQALTGLVITDTVPANSDFVSASGGGTFDGAVVQWTVASPLAPGASVVRSFDVRASDTAGVLIVNDDYGAEADNWPFPGVGSAVTTEVCPPPPTDLLLIKSGPSLAVPGETLVYSLALSNTSSIDAEDVVLVDTLSPNTTYAADDIGPYSSPAPGVYVWELGTVPAGAGATYHLTVTVKSPLTLGTVLTNQASVSTTTAEDDVADNSDDWATTVYEVITIALARQRVGQTVMIEGTVTVEPGIFVDSNTDRKLYMQDGTGGILVFRYTGLNPVARSNKVRVAGQVQVAAGETEIVPASAAHVMDQGPAAPILPAAISTGAVDESVEGELVQVRGKIVSKPAPYTMNVDDGSGIVQIYRYISLGFANDPNYIDTSSFEVGNHIQAAGVSAGFESGGLVTRTILPRGPADVHEYYVVTFVYHDLEDVVHLGEEVSLAGSFNDWDPHANPLAADATYSVFSTTLVLETPAHSFRYLVHSGGEQWNWLNTLDRSINLSGSATLNHYRNVDVSFAQLLSPPAITINLGEATGPIEGQVGIPEVTDPPGEGRGVWAEVGYGTGTNPSAWIWTAMSYAGRQAGTYDVYSSPELLPAASGVYSYAVRFDGNWGVGNPNAGWTVGDLDGTGLGDRFELIQTGVLTVTGPSLSITKDVQPAADVAPGGTITYTIVLSNGGDGPATGIALVDNLPDQVTFGGWLQQSGATLSGGTVGWAGDLEPGATVTIIFTATVDADRFLLGQTITNSASYTSANGGSGSDSAVLAMLPRPRVYLPLVFSGYGP
jgi:uncharacterized repeat protein (TIGR01451 family)